LDKALRYLPIIIAVPLVAIISVFLYEEISVSDTAELNAATPVGLGAGHFEITVKDSFGATTAYRQSDNDIMNTGENCVAKMIFRDPTDAGTGVCEGATNEAWNYLCLDESATILKDDRETGDVPESAGLSGCQQADITWNQNSTGTSDSASKVTLRLSSVFTNGGADETIYAVGVFNSSTRATNSMFSQANFTGTLVSAASTLTVNYDYEIGGGTVP